MKSKKCIKCDIVKPVSEFHTHNTGGIGGYDTRCKQCKSHSSALLYELKKQFPKPENAVCDCCGKSGNETHGKRKFDGLVMDHCHDTNKFRGWICQSCNRGIGCLGDNIDGLKMAIKYLESIEKRSNALRRKVKSPKYPTTARGKRILTPRI
jgi:hypothetical protein